MPSLTSIATATAAAISNIDGSQTLEHFMNGVARDIQDPESGSRCCSGCVSAESSAPAMPKTARKFASGPTLALPRLVQAPTTLHSSIISASRRST